jgi:outer membrane protein assembly factor BamB
VNRRTLIEIGLLAAGVVVGAFAVVAFVAEPETPPENAPDPVRAPAPRSVTAEWRIWRGDTSLTGVAADVVPDKVEVVWRYRTDGPVLSSPIVAGGRVIVGSNDNRVHCVDAATGDGIWTFPTDDDVEAPPLAVDDRIVVGSADGKLYAIDSRSGKGVWEYETGDRILGGANFYRPPSGPLRILVGSYDRRLHCVDATTGRPLWNVPTDDYINGSPAVLNDTVVFGGCDGRVHVVDAMTGRTRRSVPLGDTTHVPGSVAVGAGVAYVAHVDDRVSAVSIAQGKVIWNFRAADAFFASPALTRGRVLAGGRDRILHALDKETGDEVWSFTGRSAFDSSPVIAGDRVVVGSSDGRVYAISLGSGDPVWEFALGGAVSGSVAVAGGLVFVPCEDGYLYALGSPR